MNIKVSTIILSTTTIVLFFAIIIYTADSYKLKGNTSYGTDYTDVLVNINNIKDVVYDTEQQRVYKVALDNYVKKYETNPEIYYTAYKDTKSKDKIIIKNNSNKEYYISLTGEQGLWLSAKVSSNYNKNTYTYTSNLRPSTNFAGN